jgi:hypothetical protein
MKMMNLETFERATAAQQQALRTVFDRRPLAWNDPNRRPRDGERAMTWTEFKSLVQPALGINCLMVPWAGMWLGVETDGYVHS